MPSNEPDSSVQTLPGRIGNGVKSLPGRIGRGVQYLRSKPNLAVFLVGVLLFAGGLLDVIGRQLSSSDGSRLPPAPDEPAPAGPGRVGPVPGEAVGLYLERSKALLAGRSSRTPRDPSYGLVVFDSYRKASEVQALISSAGLKAVAIQTRVPAPGFKIQQVLLAGRTITAAAGSQTAGVREELKALEGIAAGVREPGFRAIYQRQIEIHRKALSGLGKDPATVFAVVATGTNQMFGRVASAPGVRYVDLPEDPTATTQDYSFAGLIPEDAERATFVPPAT